MTRKEFLTELDHRLSSLPRREAEEHLNYYAEMLADRMEEGMSEEEAVGSMESVDTIAARILSTRYTGPVKSSRSKNGAIIATVAAVIAVTAAVVALVILPFKSYTAATGSGSSGTIHSSDLSFSTEESPSAKEAVETFDSEGIRNLEIEWTSTFVVFNIWDEDTIQLLESGTQLAMTTSVKGDTLYVKRDTGMQLSSSSVSNAFRIDDSGIKLGGLEINNSGISWGDLEIDDSGISWGDLEIDDSGIRVDGTEISGSNSNISSNGSSCLVVSIPKSLAKNGLDSITINVVSAEVEMIDINAKELSLTSVSGNCTVDGTFDDATVSTTSGEVFFAGTFTDGMFNTVSGDLDITARDAMRSFDANSVSGEILLSIPADTGFTLEFDSVSGDFYSGNFSVRENGEKYTCGDGAVKLRVDTVSGDLSLSEF